MIQMSASPSNNAWAGVMRPMAETTLIHPNQVGSTSPGRAARPMAPISAARPNDRNPANDDVKSRYITVAISGLIPSSTPTWKAAAFRDL
jgi:hypothetical protein